MNLREELEQTAQKCDDKGMHRSAAALRALIAPDDERPPINHTAVTNILDRAHAALRGMECEEIPIELGCAVVDRPELDRAVDAIAAIEEFARERGITLTEFAK